MAGDRLHDFATAVVTRQQEDEGIVDEETLKRIARDLGMSDAEYLQLAAESEAKKEKARNLRAQQRYDEAITNLEEAHLFAPLDVEINVLLADVLIRRGRKQKNPADLERATVLLRAALRAAPANREASELLNVIANNPVTSTSVPYALIGLAVAAGAAILGLLAFFL